MAIGDKPMSVVGSTSPDSLKAKERRRRRLLAVWHLRAIRATKNHRHAADTFKRRNVSWTLFNAIGQIAVLFAVGISFAGDGLFGDNSKIFSGTVSIIGALLVLTSISQLLRNYGERHVTHQALAADYGRLVRKIEGTLSLGNYSEDIIYDIQSDFDHLAKAGDMIETSLWNQTTDAKAIQTQLISLEDKLFKADLAVGK
jgi:hypothetical protein